jgi:hypothetical protein
VLNVPSPTGGGVVGRTKISDDNNPLPRDRLIFDYDFFNNVPLTTGGFDVHRYSAGFEKTFFDQRASVEVRLPFASTLDTNINATGLASRATELGNLNLTAKVLLYRGDALNIAAGLGVALPTAEDTHVFVGSTETVRIANDAVLLTPYLAYLATPNPDWFFQNWFQVGFNTEGNRVLFNDGSGLRPVGRLTDQPLLQIDAQLGYWLVNPCTSGGFLRGLAPFVELHYNTVLGNAGQVNAGDFSITAVNGAFNELNLSFGAVLLLGDRINLALGATVPTLNSNNRSFDYQLGVHGTFFFGPTYQSRTSSALVSAF